MYVCMYVCMYVYVCLTHTTYYCSRSADESCKPDNEYVAERKNGLYSISDPTESKEEGVLREEK